MLVLQSTVDFPNAHSAQLTFNICYGISNNCFVDTETGTQGTALIICHLQGQNKLPSKVLLVMLHPCCLLTLPQLCMMLFIGDSYPTPLPLQHHFLSYLFTGLHPPTQFLITFLRLGATSVTMSHPFLFTQALMRSYHVFATSLMLWMFLFFCLQTSFIEYILEIFIGI